jgi:hypothetical protein
VGAHERGQREKLERLEEEYAELTDGSALVTHEETGTVRFHFSDGAESKSLDDAVKQGEALVKFVKRQQDRA